MADSDNPFVETRLSNGLRIVMEIMPNLRSAAAGFLVNTGSRDEPLELAGVSHFLEHMCFKGTPRRSWRAINIAFDEMGSYYNAFTSKERTFYFGWVPAAETERQIELLADMMRSALPPDEFEVERGVILEEIAMSKDAIEHLVWDLIHEKLCPGHPLSWSVLGTEASIKAMTRDRMYAYFQQRYSPANIIFIAAGRIDPDRVVAAVERFCGDWPRVEPDDRRAPPAFKTGTVTQQAVRFNQQAIGVIFPAPPAGHPDAEVARALAGALGGDNSRFFWQIIQKGLAHQADVYWLAYGDCGMMVLDGLCVPENAEAFTRALQAEAAKISREGAFEAELQRVKNKRRTSLATESEAAYHRLMQVAEDVCDYDHPRTVKERLAAIDAVTVERVKKYLQAWPIEGEGLFVSLGPRDWPEI
jgi:predicted Zn-dependent peptidase